MSVAIASMLPHFNKDNFMKLTENDEGYLFPDTYFFFKNYTEVDVIKILKDNFNKKIDNLSNKIKSSGKTLKDIVNIEHTALQLDRAETFLKELGSKGKTVLFVGVKPEAKEVVKRAAESAGQPYITERWVGGVMTNFPEINKRIQKLIDLKKKKEEGALEKYTKKEKMLIDEEIARMHKLFSGIVDMKKLPDALFVVDPKKEHIAVTEAEKMHIPVVALANTDCNIANVLHPVVANDASLSSITYITESLAEAYKSGFKSNIK
jgi:small subunit ribosomal protein S2